MDNVVVTRIPIPSEILKGDWYGTVYAIDTISPCVEDHMQIVEESVKRLINEFDSISHYTVSLREVKRELVFNDERTEHYCTLVQFRVRDSY